MDIKNVEKKQIERCMLLVEDLEIGDVKKIYNKKEIAENKKIYNKDNYIIVKNPTLEQKKEILNILIKSGDGDITKAKLTQLELMELMIPILTDFKFNPNKKSDINKLISLLDINNTPDIIKQLDDELGIILSNIINEWIKQAEAISQLSTEQQNILFNEIEKEKLLNEESNKIKNIKEEFDDAKL